MADVLVRVGSEQAEGAGLARASRPSGERGSVIPIADTLVFTTSTGNAIHATNLLPKLRADLAAAGLPKVSIHDLRHSAATLLYAQGVPIETIADILGHSTPRITGELYRHKVPQLQREAMEAMQRALGS
jgi:integrase